MRWGRTAFGLLFLTAVLAGCAPQTTDSGNRFGVYYVDGQQSRLVKEDYTLQGESFSDKVEELLTVLSQEPEDASYTCAIPSDVTVDGYELADQTMLLHFRSGYEELGRAREVLLRAAVVKTLLQLEEVSSVAFAIGDVPLKDASGGVIGAMSEETFLDTFGEQEEALESDTFTLYYASEDGQRLVRKRRLIHFNNTMSAESVVLSYLAKSPNTEDGARAVLSGSTKVLSIATKDGICHVSLDASFLSQSENISTSTAVYAIVDSLTELSNISKVEITIDTATDGVVPETDTASGLYEPDMTLVEE